MRLLYLIMLVMLVAACSKKDNPPEYQGFDVIGPYNGVWVETSMKKDTINFNTPKGLLEQLPWRPPSNAAVFVMGSETFKAQDGSNKSPGGAFAYYKQPNSDTLFIYNIYVSNSFAGYKFTTNPVENTFTIDRFYDRPGLPDKISFYRIR